MPLPRLVIAIAIPREAGESASGTAAVRKGSDARMKAKEKYILSRTLKRLTGARLVFRNQLQYEPWEISGILLRFLYLRGTCL